jgi:TRAP-type C4-dicarboxylate transport system substrate-binding protein
MKRRFLSVVLTAAMVLSMTACGVSAPEAPAEAPAAEAPAAEAPAADAAAEAPATEPAADAITLVMAEVNPLDTIVGMTDQKFKEEVESRSHGSIIIDLQASGVLGSENDVLDSMLGGGGTIDMSRISAFALTSYGGQKSMLLSLPYIFTSREISGNSLHLTLLRNSFRSLQRTVQA